MTTNSSESHTDRLQAGLRTCCPDRRHFMGTGAMGLGSLALAWLLEREGRGAAGTPEKPTLERPVYDLKPKPTHHEPRARAMISLFMGGGPSHIDLFDPKPLLEQYHGKFIPDGTDLKQDSAGGASKIVMASPFKFQKQGQSGIELSELLPHTSEIVDDMTLIRSMNLGGLRNHLAGLLAMNMGRNSASRPTLGSWLTYGLGAEAEDLPAFVAIIVDKPAGPMHWANCGMLPSVYQGTFVRNEQPRILNLDAPPHLAGGPQGLQLEYLEELNRAHAQEHPGELDLTARIASYELAARMQTAAGEAFDLSAETAALQEMYGVGDKETRPLAEAMLVARRLVERGVRFVQIWYNEWDMHEDINKRLPKQSKATDRPSAALVKDLKQRGLLDTTLVHWGGEMGRLPVIQERGGGMSNAGRDHNTDGFSMWLAGGGVKRGYIHGATDDFGLAAVSDVVHHYDYLATVLHLFGLDARELVYKHNARSETILDGQPGKVVEGILA